MLASVNVHDVVARVLSEQSRRVAICSRGLSTRILTLSFFDIASVWSGLLWEMYTCSSNLGSAKDRAPLFQPCRRTRGRGAVVRNLQMAEDRHTYCSLLLCYGGTRRYVQTMSDIKRVDE